MGDELTVVGGGIGGLSAAIEAAEAGWAVRLLEARPQLGGRARTADGPYRANWGPHVIYADGPLWSWLHERGLTASATRAPLTGKLRVRLDGRARRPPIDLLRAAMGIRRARDVPVDATFREWAATVVGDEHAARISAFLGVATFDHDPGRLSAAFAHSVFRRATSVPPTVRYIPGGWSTLVARLAERARALGVRIETSSRVDVLPDPPVILAVPMRNASELLGATPPGAVTGTTTALLDLGLRRARRDPYVLSDLDASGFCETFSRPDPSLAPRGEHLVQTQAGMRPGETLESAVARLEALVDCGYDDWRERETWRRRARVHDESGALDLPGTTWRARPAVRQADGVWLVNDFAAVPGLLSEVAHHAARQAVTELGSPPRRGDRVSARARPDAGEAARAS